MRIGEAAHLVGLSAHTLRYYEKIGLIGLSKNERRGNNYRSYNQKTIDLIVTLKNLREMGFTIADIKRLKKSWDNEDLSCIQLKSVVESKIDELNTQIKMLTKSYENLNRASIGCQDCFDSVRLLSDNQ